ncbi:amyloid beta precursor like protein 1 isoform X1 [Notamacropus eugenii]|uniref:amyloid beta precursor like protein 1 isoform X1 n=1 Tax=Notamacropus eugenii TaxID=9315 RepID=UPI003B66F7AE
MGSANPAARGLGSRLGSLLLLLLLLLLPAPGSSSRGTPSPGEIAGVPQVAGHCGRLTLHRDLRTGRWEPDPQGSRRCLRDPQHVLAYCRQVYPDLQIGRVEEASRPIPMEHWCGSARGTRCPHHVVIPYHCLPGEFVSEALLVPEGCKFLHQERMDECEGSAYRHHQAQEACRSEGLILHGSGMLLPCGTDRFRGVEYVCCPTTGTSIPPQMPHSDAPTQPQSPGGEEEEEDESFPQTVDDYFVEPPGEDEEKEEGEARRLQHPSTQPPSRTNKGNPTARPTDGVDVYFGMPGEGGEHAGFLRAKMDLEERRMRQINEVMREWAEADNQARNLPKADRQALNEHFQSILQTLEEQVSGERQRLVETHAARVIALINDQRRAALEGFLAALQGDEPQAERVLQALKRYLRAEQKEQRHTIRHYQHVAAVDPEKAEQMRFQVQTHLQVIEERMNQSLGLLEQNSQLARELQPQIQELLRAEHLGPGELEAPPPGGSSEDGGGPLPPVEEEADMGATMPFKGAGSTEGDGAERLQEHKVNVSTPRGLPFHSPEIQRDELEPGMGAGTGVARGAVAGLLVVAVAVAAVVVLTLLVARRRRPYGAISHGVVEVDPMLSLEEQQLRELQRHGYENPTYRFLEERP